MGKAGFSEAKIYRALEQYRQVILETEHPGMPRSSREVAQFVCEQMVGGMERLAELKSENLAQFDSLVASVRAAMQRLLSAGRFTPGSDPPPGGYERGDHSVAFTDEGLARRIRWTDFRSTPSQRRAESAPASHLLLIIDVNGNGGLSLGGKRTPDPRSKFEDARRLLRPKATAVAKYLLWRFRRSPACRVKWAQLIQAVRLRKRNRDARKEAGRLIRIVNQHLQAVGAPPLSYVRQPEITLPEGFPKISRPLTPKS